MNFIIIDDDKESRCALEGLTAEMKNLSLIKSCTSMKEAKEVLMNDKVDVIFLDLMVDGAHELDFLNSLPYHRPHVVVVTKQFELAKEAFDLDAVDFIVKPATRVRLTKTLMKILRLNNKLDHHPISDSQIFVKENRRLTKISMKSIFLVEALADYVNIYTADKRYTALSTMKGMMDKLPDDDFMRVHKSFIVRLDAITQIEDNLVSVAGRQVPVSNSYRKEMMERLKVI